MAHISKSAFVKGVQCPRQLYYYKNNYAQRDPLTGEQRVKFKRGIDVGILAQKLFPGGRDLSHESPWQYKQAANVTRHFIEQGQPVIYEASFLYNGLYAIMDIVVNEDGRLTAYEVKNTRSVKDTHLLDASFQYHVITQAGFKVDSIAIVYPVTSPDEYNSRLPLEDLFVKEDITAQVLDKQAYIETVANNLIETVEKPMAPEKSVGEHCFTPYACDFMKICWPQAAAEDRLAAINSDERRQNLVAEKQIAI